MMKSKKIRNLISGSMGVLVVFGILIAINALNGLFRARLDLTEEKLYTLSDSTKNILNNLDRTVTLKFFFSESNRAVPMHIKAFAQRIEDMLREYEIHSNGKLVIETYDTKLDSDEETVAMRYNLTRQELGMPGAVPPLYLGLVAAAGPNDAIMPFIAPNQEQQLEFIISHLIYEATHPEKKKIGVISKLEIMGIREPVPNKPEETREVDPPWAFVSQLSRQYELIKIDTKTNALPDVDMLLLAHPRGLSDELLYAIDQYLMKGGKILAMIDGYCMQDAKDSTIPIYVPGAFASFFYPLNKSWGYDLGKDMVLADENLSSQISFGTSANMEIMPTWLSFYKSNINQREIATSPLEVLMMPMAGVLTGAPPEGVTATTLLRATDEAFAISPQTAQNPMDIKPHNGLPRPKAPLALRLDGLFPSAYSGSEIPVGSDKEAHLNNAVEDGTVVLIVDLDFVSEGFAYQNREVGTTMVPQPLNDNLNLVYNLVGQMAGSDDLLNLRCRGTSTRPFEVVLALEKKAQKRWQEEETELIYKLQETEFRIQQLEFAKNEEEQYLVTPEQQQEMEKFRRQAAETQQKLRDVRKNLRKDIETLGLRLKVINISTVPAIVALWGIAHGWRRRRKSVIKQKSSIGK